MPNANDSMSNGILATLPEDERLRWRTRLEAVQLRAGQVLHEFGIRPTHVYFPTTAAVSQRYGTRDGETLETGLIGHEGMVGIALFLGGDSMPGQAVVQSAGGAWRLPAQDLKNAFERSPAVRQLLLRYVQSRATQTAQTAVCSRHHSLERRLCTWLLQMLDRLDGSDVVVTHAGIATNLGVRREGVTEAAIRLETLGLIQHSRGHVRVLDRAGLEWRACECYAVVRKEQGRLLPMELAA